MADPKKDMEFILRTKAEGDGAEKTIEQLDKVADKAKEAAKAFDFSGLSTGNQMSAQTGDGSLTHRIALLREYIEKTGQAKDYVEELAAAEEELARRTLETAEAQERVRKESETADEALRQQKETAQRLADQEKQRVDDVREARRRMNSRELADAQAADKAQMSSLALRGASVLAITKLAGEAGRVIAELSKEAESLGVKLPDSVRLTGMAIETITNPTKALFDVISEGAREAIKDLGKAQEAAKESKDAYNQLADAKRKTDSAFSTGVITTALTQELNALRSLNEERERQQRIEGNRQGIQRGREDADTRRQIDQTRRNNDGAAETLGVAQIEGQAAKRELARQQADAAKALADAEARAKAIAIDLEAVLRTNQALKNDAESARTAEDRLRQKTPLIGATPDQQTALARASKTREEKDSALKGSDSQVEQLQRQLEQADGAFRELVAMSADNHKQILQEFGDAMGNVNQAASDTMTQAAKAQIDAVEQVRQKIQEEGGKVSERTERLIAELAQLISDKTPDAAQIAPIQNAMIQLGTTTEAKDAAFLAVTKTNIAISQQTLVLVEQLKATAAQQQAQLDRLNRSK